MKKTLTVLSVAVLIITISASCKKIIDKIFGGIDVNAPDVTIVVPATFPFAPPGEFTLGTVTTKFNLDSIIRANTASAFNVSIVKSIKIKQIKINILEADASNNLANFQSTRVTLSSNSNSNIVEIVNLAFPDTQASTQTFAQTNSPDLLPYLKGSELYYTVYGRLRRPTTKNLTLVTTVTLRVE